MKLNTISHEVRESPPWWWYAVVAVSLLLLGGVMGAFVRGTQ